MDFTVDNKTEVSEMEIHVANQGIKHIHSVKSADVFLSQGTVVLLNSILKNTKNQRQGTNLSFPFFVLFMAFLSLLLPFFTLNIFPVEPIKNGQTEFATS